MEGRVDLGYPAMERPGVELATFRSHIRRPDHYTTKLPQNQRRDKENRPMMSLSESSDQ